MSSQPLSRRALLGGAVAGAGLLVPAAPALAQELGKAGPTDLELLQAALDVERAQLDLHDRGLRELDELRGGERRLIGQIAEEDTLHARALEQLIRQLGGAPESGAVPDLGDALGGRQRFLERGSRMKDAAVWAHNGVAARLEEESAVLALARIAQVEARHAAGLRLARDERPAPRAFDHGISPTQARRRIASL